MQVILNSKTARVCAMGGQSEKRCTSRFWVLDSAGTQIGCNPVKASAYSHSGVKHECTVFPGFKLCIEHTDNALSLNYQCQDQGGIDKVFTLKQYSG